MGSHPCFSTNRQTPEDVPGVHLTKYKAIGTTSAQLPFFSVVLATIELSVPCRHSTTPIP